LLYVCILSGGKLKVNRFSEKIKKFFWCLEVAFDKLHRLLSACVENVKPGILAVL
jgi:hypothetical protein